MRRTIVTLPCGWVLAALLAAGTASAQDGHGSIVGWGGQVVGADLSQDMVAVAGGYGHSLGLKGDGSIVPWGGNGSGQCDVPAPNTDFVALAAGMWHSLGLKADGAIEAWGDNSYAQCDVPAPNTDFVWVAADWHRSLGIKGYPRGDMNCDSIINAYDIDGFILALSTYPDFEGYYEQYPDCDPTGADCNADGIVNAYDIDAFIDLVGGG